MTYSIYNKTADRTQGLIYDKPEDAVQYAADLAKSQPDQIFEVLHDVPQVIATVSGKVEVTIKRIDAPEAEPVRKFKKGDRVVCVHSSCGFTGQHALVVSAAPFRAKWDKHGVTTAINSGWTESDFELVEPDWQPGDFVELKDGRRGMLTLEEDDDDTRLSFVSASPSCRFEYCVDLDGATLLYRITPAESAKDGAQ